MRRLKTITTLPQQITTYLEVGLSRVIRTQWWTPITETQPVSINLGTFQAIRWTRIRRCRCSGVLMAKNHKCCPTSQQPMPRIERWVWQQKQVKCKFSTTIIQTMTSNWTTATKPSSSTKVSKKWMKLWNQRRISCLHRFRNMEIIDNLTHILVAGK